MIKKKYSIITQIVIHSKDKINLKNINTIGNFTFTFI